MTNLFEMHLIVPPKLVGTIVELMSDEGIIVTMNPYKNSKKQIKVYAGGKRNKGISGEEAVLTILKDAGKPMTHQQVGKLMASKFGFSANSSSPVLSRLAKGKKVIYKDKFYSVPK